MGAAEHLATLDAAETIARIYGDTETAARLEELAAEVRTVETDHTETVPICPSCGGDVDLSPRIQCQQCGLVFFRQ